MSALPNPMVRGTAEGIDEVLTREVLVVGSLPPHGRDLDLLARDSEQRVVQRWLRVEGYVRCGGSWVGPGLPGTVNVDLASTARWSSPRFVEDLLFVGATPIPGFRRLLRPAPAVTLLLASRGMVRRRGRVTEKLRGRVRDAESRDPACWAAAAQLAGPAGLARSLDLLRAACRAQDQLSLLRRALGTLLAGAEGGPRRRPLSLLREALPARRRTVAISFSGLDGSGKSTQVARLAATLRELGVASHVQWVGFKTGSRLRGALPALDREPRSARRPVAADPLLPLRCQSRSWARHLWVLVVVLANVVSEWRHLLVDGRGHRVVIFDRFTADAAVKLDLHYRVNRCLDVDRERALFRWLAPRADIGILVAVPPEVAHARRPEQAADEASVMAALYDEQVDRLGLVRIDGTAPADVLARLVLAALGEEIAG